MRDHAALAERAEAIWRRAGNISWEPRGGRNHPATEELLAGGWLRHCTLRFGFEAMGTGVTWTAAALAYFDLLDTSEDEFTARSNAEEPIHES